jgi:hypothetical protein
MATVCGDGGDIADGVLGKSGAGFGVSGESGNVAVYARNTLIAAPNTAYLGSRCCTGDFYGQVYVHGNFTVAGGHKGFKIDHPLDPADRCLNHFSVDSPDVKNVYDGLVELDEGGEAVVELPEYLLRP